MFKKPQASNKFSLSVQAALQLAQREANHFHHQYIGTEHMLLGLVLEESGVVADVLGTFNVDADKIKSEIEKLVQRGPENALSGDLPFTPRANRALDIAADESHNLCQNSVGPEHLLLGLILEGTGVAAQVLTNLGLKVHEVGREAFRIRLAQMKIVERVVRPVRATVSGKRKMREELLAHLTAIYDEEFARLKDSATALRQAEQRFGETAALAQELDGSVSVNERIGYYIDRWLSWRAPESAAHYMMRQSRLSFFIIAAIGIVPALAAITDFGGHARWQIIRPFVAALLFTPIAQFAIGMLYFKLCDSMLGAFGKRKSRLKALMLDAAMVPVVVAVGFGFVSTSTGDYARAIPLLLPFCVAAVAVACGYLFLARFRGPTEIRDTIWALLDLKQIGAD